MNDELQLQLMSRQLSERVIRARRAAERLRSITLADTVRHETRFEQRADMPWAARPAVRISGSVDLTDLTDSSASISAGSSGSSTPGPLAYTPPPKLKITEKNRL